MLYPFLLLSFDLVVKWVITAEPKVILLYISGRPISPFSLVLLPSGHLLLWNTRYNLRQNPDLENMSQEHSKVAL